MAKLTRTVWVLCFSLQLCLPASEGIGGLVLCQGEDGHIALEAAESGCCTKVSTGDPVQSRVAFAGNEPPSQDHCGDCLDIPLSVGLATIPKDRCSASPAAPIPAASAITASNTPELSGFQPLQGPSTLLGYPPDLCSIILLI